MVKIFMNEIDVATDETKSRDLTTLADEVNGFLGNPRIIPSQIQSVPFWDGAIRWIVTTIDYRIQSA